MVFIITGHGYDWTESMGKEEFLYQKGYIEVESEEEAEYFVESLEKVEEKYYETRFHKYPYYTFKEIEKLN